MSAGSRIRSVPQHAALTAIRLYRSVMSPLLPPSCRFTPTCSSYALTSIERYGLLRGGWLATRRLARCHPFNPGGHDPVPDINQP